MSFLVDLLQDFLEARVAGRHSMMQVESIADDVRGLCVHAHLLGFSGSGGRGSVEDLHVRLLVDDRGLRLRLQ